MYWDSGAPYEVADGRWTIDTWHHWAIVRDGTGSDNMKFYWNGEYVTQWSSNTAMSVSHWGRRFDTTSYQLSGYMDEIRFTDGTAKYSGTETGAWSNFDEITTAFNASTEIIYPSIITRHN